MNRYSRIQALINLDAVETNFLEMGKDLSADTKIIAVIKADGYGHGAVPIAQLIEKKENIWGFAVATVEEAVILKENHISKPILILGYTFDEHVQEIVRLNIIPTVFKLREAVLFSDEAKRQGKIANIHLALDTGMTRIGLKDNQEGAELAIKIGNLENLRVGGIFTHFARADEEDKTSVRQQMERFKKFCKLLKDGGMEIPMKHCCNSAGLIDLPEMSMNAVRAGISIYGIYPSDEVKRDRVRLEPAMQLKSHIVYIKEVEVGVPISYGGTYVTTRKTRVATIPVGYADGYPRGLSNVGWVLIHGKKAPILGRVCMDQFMVDVTEIKEAKELDEAVLLGHSKNEVLTVEELSEVCGRFPYEFVCDIGKRVPRVYTHKGEIVSTTDYFNK